MRKGGPIPKPKSILLARGSRKARKDDGEITCSVEIPPAPDDFDKMELLIWNQLTSLLYTMRVIGQVDEFVLERYCRDYVRWRAAMRTLKERGADTYESVSKTGAVYYAAYPEVAICSNLSASLLKIEQQFGMTASSRSSIKLPAENKPEDNGKSRFFAS